MLCERCNKNQATVHMKKMVNGSVEESHLCTECAGVEDYNTFSNMFQDLFSYAGGQETAGTGTETVKCPACGMTYEGFKKGGKLGCESCYTAFSNPLSNTLKSIHGSSEHKGKIPQKSGGIMLAKREKENLKRKLALAIEREEFEEAAKLRDKIRKLEGGGGQ